MPVSSDALAGEHTGDTQKKSVNRIPASAIRSRFGVYNSSAPAQCIAQAPWSSARINTILGLSFIRIRLLPQSGKAGI